MLKSELNVFLVTIRSGSELVKLVFLHAIVNYVDSSLGVISFGTWSQQGFKH